MPLQNPILIPKQPFLQLKADDLDIGLKLRYVGSEASATITVSSSGDLTFKQGDAGSEVVDPSINSDDDPGVIDVSDSSASNFGKVVDMINGSDNWEAYLVGVLRADVSDASTGSLLARSETTININSDDTPLFKDTSKVLNIAIRVSRRNKVNGEELKAASEIYEIQSLNTFASGTNIIKVYEIDEVEKTETLVYSRAGGATTVEDVKEFVVNGRGSMGVSKQGTHLLVKMVGSVECTGDLQVIGATATGL